MGSGYAHPRSRRALALLVAAMAGLACSPREVGQRTRTEIEEALEQAGLRICNTDQTSSGLEGTEEIVRLDVAVERCGSDATGNIVVATAPSEAERDRLLSALLAVPRPRFADAVWKFGTTMVLLSGVPDDDVVDRLQEAMSSLGA